MAAWPPPVSRDAGHPLPVEALLLSDGETSNAAPARFLLQDLSEPERLYVERRATRRVLNKGATLFNQGVQNNGIYLIESGRVRVFYTSPAGREVTLAYWYPGNFVGGPEVFGTGIHLWSGVATCSSSVLHINGQTLKDLISQFPVLAIRIIEGLTFKGRCYSTMAQMLGTRSITERLAHLLLHLADLYGIENGDGSITIDANFTHADMAHFVGATRQWVTISLRRFAQRNILQTHRSGILIRRPDLLASIRDGGEA